MKRIGAILILLLVFSACRKPEDGGGNDDRVTYPEPPKYVGTPGFPDSSLDLEGKYVVYEDDPSSANYYVTHSDTTLRGFRISPLDENRLLIWLR